jgi:hypothetical protein
VHYENMKKVHLLSCRVHRQLYFYWIILPN